MKSNKLYVGVLTTTDVLFQLCLRLERQPADLIVLKPTIIIIIRLLLDEM
jgi:hypothetical protein